jgi:hypothetical protein
LYAITGVPANASRKYPCGFTPAKTTGEFGPMLQPCTTRLLSA